MWLACNRSSSSSLCPEEPPEIENSGDVFLVTVSGIRSSMLKLSLGKDHLLLCNADDYIFPTRGHGDVEHSPIQNTENIALHFTSTQGTHKPKRTIVYL